MTDLPAAIGWMTVNGKLILGYSDSDDAGSQPDAVSAVATVTFAPDLNTPKPITLLADGTMIAPATIKATLNSDGSIVPPRDGLEANPNNGAAPGIILIAPKQPGVLSNTTWTWTATFQPAAGQKWKQFSITFTGAPGDVIILGKVEEVPVNPGAELSAWLEAVAATHADRAAVEAARDDVEAHAAAVLAVPAASDGIVSGLIGNPASSTATALSATIAAQPGQAVDELRTLYAAVAGRASAPVDIVVIGDSNSEGEGSGTISGRWLDRLAASARGTFQPLGTPGGIGYVPAWSAIVNPAPATASFTPSGSGVAQSTIYGFGRRSATLTAGGTLTRTAVCSAFSILYAGTADGGVFSVSIDGGTPVNIDTTTGPALGGRIQVFTPTQRGSHTIVLAHVSGAPIVEGMFVMDGDTAKGLRFWDASHYGFTSSSFASNGTWNQSLFAFTADAVMIALGTNDFGTNVPPATYEANIRTIITGVRARVADVPIVLIGMPERIGSFASPWSAYLAALRKIADDTTGVRFIDAAARFPKGSTSDPTGLFVSDGIHLSARGHQFLADIIFADLFNGIRGAVTIQGIVDETGKVILSNTIGLELQRKSAGTHGRILVNTADQIDVQGAGGSIRFANNAYNAINLEISDSGTILTRLNTNLAVSSGAGFGGGIGVTSIRNAQTVPTSNPTGGGILYVEAGALKYRGSSGTVTILGPA